jgi:sugar phosphate isomerase/epimerase
MRFCIRREIDFASTEERLRKVQGIPIEIAFPPKIEEFLEGRLGLMEVRRCLAEFEIPVRSVHAPHGDLATSDFRNWAPIVAGFAEAVAAEIVVFHPEIRPEGSREEHLATCLDNIKFLQERTNVLVSLETFREHDRVLTPDDIMKNNLPMVLDTSLIPKTEITWIMESYHTHVSNIHLSAVSSGSDRHESTRQFRPIDNDPFCLDILDRLNELKWNGVVTLEYLPWLSNKSVEDRMLLERIYQYNQITT